MLNFGCVDLRLTLWYRDGNDLGQSSGSGDTPRSLVFVRPKRGACLGFATRGGLRTTALSWLPCLKENMLTDGPIGFDSGIWIPQFSELEIEPRGLVTPVGEDGRMG